MAKTSVPCVTIVSPKTSSRPYAATVYVNGRGGVRVGKFATVAEAEVAVAKFRDHHGRRGLSQDEWETRMVEPILPSQIRQNGPSVASPHLALREAVLRQAIRDLSSGKREVSLEAKLWFEGKVLSEPTFNFSDICDLCEADLGKAIASVTQCAQ